MMMTRAVSVSFLSDNERRSFQFKKQTNLEPVGLVLGRGGKPLEIAIARAVGEPTRWEAWEAWQDRLAGREVPLLLVILYGGRAMTCGPVGGFGLSRGIPVLWDRNPRQVERVCRAALNIVGGDAAARFLWDSLPEVKSK